MIVPIVGALFVCYFLVHAFQGDRGVLAWMHLQKQVAIAEQTLAETKAIRTDYESRISLSLSTLWRRTSASRAVAEICPFRGFSPVL